MMYTSLNQIYPTRASASRASMIPIPATGQSFSSIYPMPMNLHPQLHSLPARLDIPQKELKRSRSHSSRQSMRRSKQRTSSVKSNSDSTTTAIQRTNSWHSTKSGRPTNFSVAYAQDLYVTPKRKRRSSMKRIPPTLPKSPLSVSTPPLKRVPSVRKLRKSPLQKPEFGLVRISTFDELPIQMNPQYRRRNSINTDRLSIKGNTKASSVEQKQRSTQTIQSRKHRQPTQKSQNRNHNDQATLFDADDNQSILTQSSSTSSVSSLQTRINRSLRRDPLINAAIEDFRKHRQTSIRRSRNEVQKKQDIDDNSGDSESTIRSRSSSSSKTPTRSRNHSQSSLTSVERLEIREIIKTFKSRPQKKHEPKFQKSKIMPSADADDASNIYAQPSMTTSVRPEKSLITQELDQAFSKLRGMDPNQDLTYVTPSSICKKRKAPIAPISSVKTPEAPTFADLLKNVQLRPIEKKSIEKKNFNDSCLKGNLETAIPFVAVPQSSPIPPFEDDYDDHSIHEYAKPMKRNLNKPFAQDTSIQQVQSTEQSIIDLLPSTFQPTRTLHPTVQYKTMNSNNENTYNCDGTEHETILTDYYYSDCDPNELTTMSVTGSSIFPKFSRLFSRKSRHTLRLEEPQSRCSIM